MRHRTEEKRYVVKALHEDYALLSEAIKVIDFKTKVTSWEYTGNQSMVKSHRTTEWEPEDQLDDRWTKTEKVHISEFDLPF